MIGRRNVVKSLGGTLLLSTIGAKAASGQGPLHILVPYGPGGITDSLARMVAEALTTVTSRVTVIDNKPGGGGMVGTRVLMNAPKDGSTLILQNQANFVAQPVLLKDANYDPRTDVVAVAAIGTTPSFLYINSKVPARDLKEFLAYAKANPAKLNFATSGVTTAGFIKLTQLQKLAGITVSVVPYKSGDEMTLALFKGEVQAMITTPTAALRDQIASGSVRMLAVTTRVRSPLAPDVPTIAETFPSFTADNWWGFYAPKGTPLSLFSEFTAGLQRILLLPKVRQQCTMLYVEPTFHDAAELAKETARSFLDYKRLGVELNVTPQ